MLVSLEVHVLDEEKSGKWTKQYCREFFNNFSFSTLKVMQMFENDGSPVFSLEYSKAKSRGKTKRSDSNLTISQDVIQKRAKIQSDLLVFDPN